MFLSSGFEMSATYLKLTERVVQLLSHVWRFVSPWTVARQVHPPSTISWRLLKFMSIESVMSSNHLILYCPFSFCPQSFPASGSFPMSTWLIHLTSHSLPFTERWYHCQGIRGSQKVRELMLLIRLFSWKDLISPTVVLIWCNFFLSQQGIIDGTVHGLWHGSDLDSNSSPAAFT